MLWRHRMLQNDAGAEVLPRFVSMCIPCRLRTKSKIGIQQCVGLSQWLNWFGVWEEGSGKCICSWIPIMQSSFFLWQRDGKHKRVLMTWERIRTMWVDKRISEKQSHWVIEDTVWMSMNWWTRKRREIKVTDWMQAPSGESEESELKWNGERREKQERDR